jgi:hypothetical protein
MVGGYLVGQLSEPLYRGIPGGLHLALDALYCVVPDLTPVGYLEGSGASGSIVALACLQTGVQAAFLFIVSALLVTRERAAVPSPS